MKEGQCCCVGETIVLLRYARLEVGDVLIILLETWQQVQYRTEMADTAC